MTLGPVLNTVLEDLGIPLARGGTPAFTYFFATMIGILLLNFVMAKVPVKWCLCGCAFVEAVGLTATALLARGLWSFAGLYFIVGLPCWLLAGIPGMWISAHVREKTAWAMNIVANLPAPITPARTGLPDSWRVASSCSSDPRIDLPPSEY